MSPREWRRLFVEFSALIENDTDATKSRTRKKVDAAQVIIDRYQLRGKPRGRPRGELMQPESLVRKLGNDGNYRWLKRARSVRRRLLSRGEQLGPIDPLRLDEPA